MTATQIHWEIEISKLVMLRGHKVPRFKKLRPKWHPLILFIGFMVNRTVVIVRNKGIDVLVVGY